MIVGVLAFFIFFSISLLSPERVCHLSIFFPDLTLFFVFMLQRNYLFFIMFISSSTLLCIYVFAVSWVNILRQNGTLWFVMSRDVLSVALIIYCFVVVWFVGGLTVFHLYLISTNQVFFFSPLLSLSFFNSCHDFLLPVFVLSLSLHGLNTRFSIGH